MESSCHNPASKIAFSFGDVGFAIKLIGHLARASAPDITWGTFTRFFAAPGGNKERIASLSGYVATDPRVLQRIVHNTDGDYRTLKKGQAYVIRDFDLWVKCSTALGHRGDYVPELFSRSVKGGCFAAQPSQYGPCPFGNHDVYVKEEPHNASKNRLSEQGDMMRSILRDYFDSYLGKTVEVGVLMRLLVWNVYTASSLGIMPSQKTEEMLHVYDDHLKEFEYAIRMAGSKLPYKWSPKLQEQFDTINGWAKDILEDRIANIEKYQHQSDLLTDTLLNHPDADPVKAGFALRGVYPGGFNNFHTAICGTIIHNGLNNDEVYKYYVQNPKENIEHIMYETFRLYTSIANFRNVREEDNLSIDGIRLETGADVLLSTYGVNTDPRSWENPMQFNPSRFESTEDINFMFQKGFVPFGAPRVEMGGRPCPGQYQNVMMMSVMLNSILSEYKLKAKGGGYFDFKSNSGTSVYCGKCYVTVEKR